MRLIFLLSIHSVDRTTWFFIEFREFLCKDFANSLTYGNVESLFIFEHLETQLKSK